MATISIDVNSKPVVTDADFETNEIGPLTGQLESTDAESDPVTFSIDQEPQQGTVTFVDDATGEFGYTPDDGASGADSFTFIASDEFQDSAAATVSVEIFPWLGTQQFGTAEDEFAGPAAFIRDETTNFYIARWTGGVLGGGNFGGEDEFLQKRDRNGNVLWTLQTGTTSDDYRKGLAAIPGSNDVFTSTRDAISRLNDAGQELWSNSIDLLINPSAVNHRIAADASGNVVTVHWDVVNTDVVTRIDKLSGTGDPVWSRRLETASANPADPWLQDASEIVVRGLAFDSQDNVVIVGSVVTDRAEGFVAKLDGSNGSDIWRQFDLDTSDPCSESGLLQYEGVVLDDNEQIFAVGRTLDSDAQDAVLTRFASGGVEQWLYCDESAFDLTVLPMARPARLADGDLVTMADHVIPDPADGQPQSDVLVLYRHRPDGTLVWRREIRIQDASGEDAIARRGGLVVDEQDFIYITGSTEGEAGDNANSGIRDVFLMRFDPDGNRQ